MGKSPRPQHSRGGSGVSGVDPHVPSSPDALALERSRAESGNVRLPSEPAEALRAVQAGPRKVSVLPAAADRPPEGAHHESYLDRRVDRASSIDRSASVSDHHRSPSEIIRTHSEMLAAEAEYRAATRRLELDALCSALKTPEERIRAWERLHGLTLPRNPNHAVLGGIALKTGLTLQEVQAVQRNDAERRMRRTEP